jgi:phosphoglycolate phosphatase-like HAD superfamily hydrolase
VDELHRQRFGTPLGVSDYEAYDRACLARFVATFHPEGRSPIVHQGIVTGLAHLVDAGHRVWLVSGNPPKVLDFKARMLGVDARVPRLGSLPHLDRVGLLRKALDGCVGPHLYVGDRPHDRDAAAQAGVPFLAVGEAVPGEHPTLNAEAEAEQLVGAVQRILHEP